MAQNDFKRRLISYWTGTSLTVIGVIAVTSLSLWHSGTFEECLKAIPENKASETYSQGLSLFTFLWGERVGCLGPFVHENADPIIAVFTILLAIATIRLWVSTNRLWEGAERSSERQLRAYVLIEGADIYDASKIGLHSIQPETTILHQWTGYVACDLAIKNSGQTPAKKVRHWAKLAISTAADEHELLPPLIQDEQQSSVIAPGGTVSKSLIMLPFPLVEPVLSEVISGAKGIYLVGKIVYLDIFEVERTSIYRLRYAGPWPPMPRGTMNFALHGNNFD